jgi:hypothetical protein
MPVVHEVFTPVTGRAAAGGSDAPARSLPVATVKQLHDELAAIGLPVTGDETGATPSFGAATSARLVRFQQRYQLPADGKLDPTTGGLLTLSALVASETDRAKLRAELAGTRGAVAGSAAYDQWLARFAVMAGAYDLASSVAPHVRDLFGNDLGSGVFTDGSGNAPPRQPEVPFPENFYAYRFPLIAQADIDQLRLLRTSGDAEVRAYFARSSAATGTQPQPLPYPQAPLPPTTPTTQARGERLANAAEAWLAAIEAWQLGNNEFAQQRYASAAAAYDRCQQAALEYFTAYPDYDVRFTTTTVAARIDELLWWLASDPQRWSDLWEAITWRRQLLSLAELGQHVWLDTSAPPPIPPGEIL